MSITEAQKHLDQTLKTSSPALFERLSPPADDATIDSLRTELGGSRRESLELWFKWHNGGDSVALLPLGRMLSVGEAIEDRRMNQSIPLMPRSRQRDIKILDDGAGDGYFLNLSADPPYVYYEMLEDPGMTSYGTMEEFLGFIQSIHSAGAVETNEDGAILLDLPAYDVLEAKYLATVNGDG